MKTVLHAPSWLENEDHFGCSRLERTKRWLTYYKGIQEQLGFDEIYFADNASSEANIQDLYRFNQEHMQGIPIQFYRFEKGLYLGPQTDDYPYAWRGIYFMRNLIEAGYTKIILADTDSFILSLRLADFIRTTNTGYYSFFSNEVQYAATEISVMNEDAFEHFINWTKYRTWEDRSQERRRIETELPFTAVYHQFVGDRYGFGCAKEQNPEMDWYSQCRLTTKITFNMASNAR